MTELDTDFGADDEVKPFIDEHPDNYPIGPNYTYDEVEEDDDLNAKSKPPKRIKELDDSDDELDETQKHLQEQLKTNFNHLFANKNNMDDHDCVIEEEIESKEYNKEHGEQKMEPFNLREERGEGYFDQFLNYHKTKNEDNDPFYVMLDEDKDKHKNSLSDEVIRKHKRDYRQFEQTRVANVMFQNEWKALLPLFSNDNQTIEHEMQTLSKIIKQNDNSARPAKKRKLNNAKPKPKKNKLKRAWEIAPPSPSEDAEDLIPMHLTDRQLLGYKKRFELFSEKSTMLFANGDHNIYRQTRNSLIRRIGLVETKDEVLWEYYWKDDQKKQKHGPFTCKQMSEWNELYFKSKPIMFKTTRSKKWLCSQQIKLQDCL
eukprot:143803_1